MKKILIAISLIALIIFYIASDGFTYNPFTYDGKPFNITNFKTSANNSNNKYVLMVRNGYREGSHDITYDEAFSAFFTTPKWEYFKSTEGLDVVEFTGDCVYKNTNVKATIQFIVDENSGMFEAAYLDFNEVPQDEITLIAIIIRSFEEVDN